MELEHKVDMGDIRDIFHNLGEVNRENEIQENLDKMGIEYNQLLDIEGACFAISTFMFVILYLLFFRVFKSDYILFMMPLLALVFYDMQSKSSGIFRTLGNVFSFLTSYGNFYESKKKIEKTIDDMCSNGYIDNIEQNLIVAQDLLLSTPQIAYRFEENKVFLEKIKGYIVNIQTAGEYDKKRTKNVFLLNNCTEKLNRLLEELTLYSDNREVKKDKMVSNVKLL